MTRTRWAAVMTAYAALSIVAAIFLSVQVPLCSGVVPTGQMNEACVEAWRAARPWWLKLFDTPMGPVVVFLALAVLTWALVLAAGRWRQSRNE